MKKLAKSVKPVKVVDGDEEESSIGTTKKLMLQTLELVQPGLIVFMIPPDLILSHVRSAVEHQARSGGQKMGLRFPKKMPVKSLYAGNGRKVSEAKALALAQTPLDGASHEFVPIGTRESFNLVCDEGLCVVHPIIEKAKGSLVTFAQTIDAPSGPLAEALIRLRQTAKQAGSFVLLFLKTDRRPNELQLTDYCDDVVVIAKCSPDPSVLSAFSTDVIGLRDLNEVGIGKMMCSVRFRNGQYTWTWSSFIAADILNRVIWKLRGSGKTFNEIGKIVKCDKSTVHRHMADLPPLVERKQKEGWLKPYADLIDIAIDSDDDSDPESKEE